MTTATGGYDHGDHMRRKSAAKTRASQQIPEIPPVADLERRESCKFDLPQHYYTYRHQGPWPLAPYHQRMLEDAQQAVLEGRQIVRAVPRGGLKSTLLGIAIEWAVCHGHTLFPAMVCAEGTLAKKRFRGLKTSLQHNDLYLADFPELCVPIRATEGESTKAIRLRYNDEPLLMKWGDELVFPWIPELPKHLQDQLQRKDAPMSGGTVLFAGIKSGKIRGALHQLPSGKAIRPTVVLFDDPQTRVSAKSPMQSDDRWQILESDIMELAPPDQSLAILGAVTVIYIGDLAERMLAHEEWISDRVPMVTSMPDNLEIWAQWNETRVIDGLEAANGFYETNREEMDRGGSVSWEERCRKGRASALADAMERYFRNPAGFASEMQQQPLSISSSGLRLATVDEIMAKGNGLPRYVLPAETEHLAAYVDVGQDYLYLSVMAGWKQMSASVVHYGPWPEQPLPYFSKTQPAKIHDYHARAREQKRENIGWKAALTWALGEVCDELMRRYWTDEGGGTHSIERIIIDSRWDKGAGVIKSFLSRMASKFPVIGSIGMGLKPNTRPFTLDKAKVGETIGHHWKFRKPQNWTTRALLIDTNRWKSRLHEGWATPIGDEGAVSLFSVEADGRKADHRMYAEHQHAEYPSEMTGNYGSMDIWEMRPGTSDNEGLDTATGAYVGLSTLGLQFSSQGNEEIQMASRTVVSASQALESKSSPPTVAPVTMRTRKSAAEALGK